MSESNLRQTVDAFKENVNLRLPSTLYFDGERLYLTADATAGAIQAGRARVGITDDLTDDEIYRLTREDIDQVAEEMDVKLTEEDLAHIQKGVDSGFGNCWWDIIESAIADAVKEREQKNEGSETND